MLESYEQWDVSQIESRQGKLMQLAKKVWEIEAEES